MTLFCELTEPDADCHDLVAFVRSMVDALQVTPRIIYHEAIAAPVDDAELTALWGECAPPDCAIVVWFDTVLEEFTVWSYIDSDWQSTGSVSNNTPYYTEFEGIGGEMQEGWEGGWIINGEGRIYPNLVLGDELLLNSDFEDWTGGNLDDWTVSGTETEENVIVHTGASSALIALAGVPPNGNVSQVVTVVEGRWFKAFVYINQTDTGDLRSFTLSGGWTSNTATQTGSPNIWDRLDRVTYSYGASVTFTAGGTFDDLYVDTASLKEVESGWNAQKDFYSAFGTLYVDFTRATYDAFGILLNYVDDDNYAMVIATPTGRIALIEMDAGVATETNDWAYVYVAGARLEVYRDSADQVTIDYNGANIVTDEPLVTPKTGTIHGIISVSPDSYATAFGYTPE